MQKTQIWLTKENVKKLSHICKKNKDFLSYSVIDATDKVTTHVEIKYTNIESLVIVILNGLMIPKIY
jgi:hypothetical protein